MQQQHKIHAELLPLMSVVQAQLNQPLTRALPNDPALLVQCNHVQQLSAAHDLPVRYTFCLETFRGHRVYQGQQYDWVVFDIEEHPLLAQGKLPVPRRIQQQLTQINRVMEFDAIYIAEEVEPGSISPYEPLRAEPFLPPPSRTLVEESRQLGGWSENIGKLLAAPWTWVATGGAIATMALPLILTGLDPILFGLKTATGDVSPGTLAAFHYLGHWAWNDERGGD